MKEQKFLHTWKYLYGWDWGVLYNLREEHSNRCSEGKMEKIHHGDHC